MHTGFYSPNNFAIQLKKKFWIATKHAVKIYYPIYILYYIHSAKSENVNEWIENVPSMISFLLTFQFNFSLDKKDVLGNRMHDLQVGV